MRFKSKAHMITTLMSGVVLKARHSDNLLKFDETHRRNPLIVVGRAEGDDVTTEISSYYEEWAEEWEEYKEPQWFDNISSQGVLCRVWDSNSDVRQMVIINEYIPMDTYEFRDVSEEVWKHAEPVLIEEVKPLILGEQQ